MRKDRLATSYDGYDHNDPYWMTGRVEGLNLPTGPSSYKPKLIGLRKSRKPTRIFMKAESGEAQVVITGHTHWRYLPAMLVDKNPTE